MASATPHILFVDAYDSFSSSIVALLYQLLDVNICRIKIDSNIETEFQLDKTSYLTQFEAIILGPGPGHPEYDADVGLFKEIWAIAAVHQIPVLGICLGFQSLCCRYGLKIERLPLPCHGHAKRIIHGRKDIFCSSSEVIATQYNSLGVRAKRADGQHDTDHFDGLRAYTLPCEDIELLAINEDDYAMAVRHRSLPFWGLQFHPESCTSDVSCHFLLEQWYKEVKNVNVDRRTPARLLRQTCSKKSTMATRVRSVADEVCCYMQTLSSQSTANVTHKCVQQWSLDREQIADLCYEASKSNGVVMLESSKGARFSIYGMPDASTWRLEVYPDRCVIVRDEEIRTFRDLQAHDVLLLLKSFMDKKRVRTGVAELPFWGGLVGFQSYEFGLDLLGADVKPETSDPLVPYVSLIWIDRSIVVDHTAGHITAQSLRHNDDAWISDTIARVAKIKPARDIAQDVYIRDLLSDASISLPDHDGYISQVEACRQELLAGNSYELCLTTEATITARKGTNHSYLLYKNLQRHNPVPYAAYMQLGQETLLSSSPEKFLDWSSDDVVNMVPMKGTVRKSKDMTLEKAKEVLASPKEQAENIMIADLIRHDLYTAISPEKVKVDVIKLCEVQEFEQVYQLVSHIRAYIPPPPVSTQRAEPVPPSDLGLRALRCSLPPGSMTGAPKKRSCEILSGLEGRSRGIYSGVIGFMDVGGRGSWSVCIRSAFSTAKEDDDTTQLWHVGAGGAITVLSDSEAEWQEMLTKLNNVLGAFQ